MAKVNYELLYPELNEYIEKNYTKNAEAKTVVGQSTFSDTLLARIKESSLTEAQCYRKAGVDKALFNKIKTDKLYRPRKTAAIAFALALELPLAEAKKLLSTAGYELTCSNKVDVVVRYHIEHGVYNLSEINEALYSFELPLIQA